MSESMFGKLAFRFCALSLAALLSLPSSATVAIGNLTADLRYAARERSVYFEARRLQSPHDLISRMRVSEPGVIRQLLHWRRGYYVLDDNGTLWALDTSLMQVNLGKILDTAIAAAGVTAYSEFGIAISSQVDLAQLATFMPLSFLAFFTVFSVPVLGLAKATTANSVAAMATLGLLQGRNFFLKPVLTNVDSIERLDDDYQIRYKDERSSTLSQERRSYQLSAGGCEEWLIRMATR